MTAGFVSAIKFDVTEPDLHCFIHIVMLLTGGLLNFAMW